MKKTIFYVLLALLLPALAQAQPSDELIEIPMQRILASETDEDVEPPKMTMEEWLMERGFLGGEINPEQRNNVLLAGLYDQYEEWRDVRYRMGGFSKDGIDCSGFAKLTFSQLFNINLPRNTTSQAQTGWEVQPTELRTGDLVFFRIDRGTQHVGIYLERNKFLHASSSQGVMISDMAHPYWRKRYWKSVRHDLPEKTAAAAGAAAGS